jgi:four helix bundle protein
MEEKITSFRQLVVWQKSKDLCVLIYGATVLFPREETYGLTDQLRRAAVSIPSNIAEGFHRRFPKEKMQFLRIAYGSGAEIETQLEIAKELGFLAPEAHEQLAGKLKEIMKMMNAILNML